MVIRASCAAFRICWLTKQDHCKVAATYSPGVILEHNSCMCLWARRESRVLEKGDTWSLILDSSYGLIDGGSFSSPLRWQGTSLFSIHLGSSSWVVGFLGVCDRSTSWGLSHHQNAAEEGVLWQSSFWVWH